MKRMATLALWVFWFLASVAYADEASNVFDQIYSLKVKAAIASLDRADDHALVAELTRLASDNATDEALAIVMFKESYDLAMRDPSGARLAADAMAALAARVQTQWNYATAKRIDALNLLLLRGKPEEREDAGTVMVDLLLEQGDAQAEEGKYSEATASYRRAISTTSRIKSRSADDIKVRIETVLQQARAAKRVEIYRTKLLENRNDPVTAELLVKVYLTEFDDPAAAEPYLEIVTDETLKKLVVLAAGPVLELSAAQCKTLGEWYQGLADQTQRVARAAMLERASLYYERFLEEHTANDLARTQVTLRHKQVTESLEKESPTPRRVVSRADTTGGNKAHPLTRDPRRFLFILSGKENSTASEACKRFRVQHDSADSFDMNKKDYRLYHTIVCGSNMMDYWGKETTKTPEAFQWIDGFVRNGGHLVVFGAFNGRNFHHLGPYGIKTSYNHNSYFSEEPGQTEVFFKGCEKIIPQDKKMRSAGNFSCSQEHTVLLRRGDGKPAVITMPVGKGRLTVTMVEPQWMNDYWLIEVMVTWLVRGGPVGEAGVEPRGAEKVNPSRPTP